MFLLLQFTVVISMDIDNTHNSINIYHNIAIIASVTDNHMLNQEFYQVFHYNIVISLQ